MDLATIFIIVCVALMAYFAHKLFKAGFLAKIEPVVSEKPVFLSSPLTVFYKYRLGPYSGTSSTICEIHDIVPKTATTFGIFYDNPEERDSNLLQSAVGVIYKVGDEEQFANNFAEQLIRLGFEKIVLPKVSKAVQCEHPNSGGILSVLSLVYRGYPVIKNFIETNRLETTISLEFYGTSAINVVFPLDSSDEFNIPEYKSLEQLLADKDRYPLFSSDEDSEVDDEAVDAETDGEKEETKKDE